MPKAESFVIAEYEYLAQNAFNANEDRVKVFNYYLAGAATLIASGILLDLSNSYEIAILGIIFIILGILGVLSLLTLLRLRKAWIEAVKAMNQLKTYVISSTKDKSYTQAFAWNGATIPNAKKVGSVAYLTSVTVSLISSLCFAIGWSLVLQSQLDTVSLVVSIAIFIVCFALEQVLWFVGW